MNEELEKRGPGRPPKSTEEPIKKGKPTWRPANVDDVFDKEPGYRYRWINEDQTNIAKKEAEQWNIVSDISSSATTVESGYGRINDGKSLTSVRKRVGQVLARIPEEVALERDAHMNSKTERQMAGLKRQTQGEIKGAPVHGSIAMEKKGIRTIIKD